MTVQGLDYAYGRPAPAGIRAAGYAFVCRYVSTPGNGKNLTKTEASALRAAGVDVVVVFERSASRPLGGATAGKADGAAARSQAQACGAPAASAIYAAVDFDPQPSEMRTVLAYLAAFARACAPHPCGVYGGWRVIDAASTAGVGRYLWQAGAWSTFPNPATGRRAYRLHPDAHLRQFAGTVVVDGVTCDRDVALAADYGGWALRPAKPSKPKPEKAKPSKPTPAPKPVPKPQPPTVEDDMATLVQAEGSPEVYLVWPAGMRHVEDQAELGAERAAGLAPAGVRTVSPHDLALLAQARGYDLPEG